MHIMTSNILKKIMVNNLAAKFSWAGMKGKLIFKDLSLAKIIMRTLLLLPLIFVKAIRAVWRQTLLRVLYPGGKKLQ